MGIYIIVPSPFTLEELLPLLGFYMEGSNLWDHSKDLFIASKEIVGQQELESPVVLLDNAVNFRACTYAL
jgi:hypothetical protein